MIQYVAVLPAYAGMFLTLHPTSFRRSSSPRVCGDVSVKLAKNRFTRRVLPAYAGMFPTGSAHSEESRRSPRVCGDVSKLEETS